MAGHSKFANIKHRKAAQDKKRGKIFTKLIREVTVAAKISGDIAANPRLRLVVDKALGANMTRDTIERTIKCGTGGDDDVETNQDGSISVATSFEDFLSVKEAMMAAGLEPEQAEVIEKPATTTDVSLEDAEKIMQLIDTLEDLDDVQEVHTTADFSDEVMEQLSR